VDKGERKTLKRGRANGQHSDEMEIEHGKKEKIGGLKTVYYMSELANAGTRQNKGGGKPRGEFQGEETRLFSGGK